MNKRKLLEKIYNSQTNVKFDDFVTLIEAFGFERIHINGSHRTYNRNDVPDLINIQNDKGEAKPYQVKQFLKILEKHQLKLED